MTVRCAAGILAVGCILPAACATGRPDFERRLDPMTSAGQRLWSRLLAFRYGCTGPATSPAGRGVAGVVVGMSPCDFGASVPVQRVQAWRTAEGLREDWLSGSWTISLGGADERSLHVIALRR